MINIGYTDLSFLFGEMVLASSVIKHYHGDLYHDAVALNLNLLGKQFENGQTVAIWAVGECGTHIAMSAQEKNQCSWAKVSSYAAYDHYRIVCLESRRGTSLILERI